VPPSRHVQIAPPSRGQLDEVKICIAWLADPETFPYPLTVRSTRDSMIVGGTAPTTAIRNKALQIADRETELLVIDQVSVEPGAEAPRISVSTNELHQAAVAALSNDTSGRIVQLRVTTLEGGRVQVAGTVATLEDRLAISRRLQGVKGCTSVDNQLVVLSENRQGAPVRVAVTPVPTTLPRAGGFPVLPVSSASPRVVTELPPAMPTTPRSAIPLPPGVIAMSPSPTCGFEPVSDGPVLGAGNGVVIAQTGMSSSVSGTPHASQCVFQDGAALPSHLPTFVPMSQRPVVAHSSSGVGGMFDWLKSKRSKPQVFRENPAYPNPASPTILPPLTVPQSNGRPTFSSASGRPTAARDAWKPAQFVNPTAPSPERLRMNQAVAWTNDAIAWRTAPVRLEETLAYERPPIKKVAAARAWFDRPDEQTLRDPRYAATIPNVLSGDVRQTATAMKPTSSTGSSSTSSPPQSPLRPVVHDVPAPATPAPAPEPPLLSTASGEGVGVVVFGEDRVDADLGNALTIAASESLRQWLQGLIQAACLGQADDLHVELKSSRQLEVGYKARNAQDAEQVARRVLTLPELKPFQVTVKAKVNPRGAKRP
jgi:hypothetical protein